MAIADYQSESDEDAQSREREETKRLLYVALTRARDRLYLSATAPTGVCRTGRGSLGEVLPRTLVALFGAADICGTATWTAASGRSHNFQVSSLKSQVSNTQTAALYIAQFFYHPTKKTS